MLPGPSLANGFDLANEPTTDWPLCLMEMKTGDEDWRRRLEMNMEMNMDMEMGFWVDGDLIVGVSVVQGVAMSGQFLGVLCKKRILGKMHGSNEAPYPSVRTRSADS